MADIVQILRDYQHWMQDGPYGEPSICVSDISADDTFGAAADEIERLRGDLEAATSERYRLLLLIGSAKHALTWAFHTEQTDET